jgi:hypothetical protein
MVGQWLTILYLQHMKERICFCYVVKNKTTSTEAAIADVYYEPITFNIIDIKFRENEYLEFLKDETPIKAINYKLKNSESKVLAKKLRMKCLGDLRKIPIS